MAYYKHEYCDHCGKALVAIKHRRLNGAQGHDWPSRKFHRVCWGRIGSERRRLETLKWVLEEQRQKNARYWKYMYDEYMITPDDYLEDPEPEQCTSCKGRREWGKCINEACPD